jgi:large subunit ribosomal protein L18
MLKKVQNRLSRATRVRARMTGTAQKPRLSVFRSNTSITAQVIDDVTGTTLCAASDITTKTGTKTERATTVGDMIGKAMIAKGIMTCVFDRGGCLYHGRVKALAEAARATGVQF